MLALILRWDHLDSTTKDGVIHNTLRDRWNRAVWQQTIASGRYSEMIISPSWIEAGRTPVQQQIERQVLVSGGSDDPLVKFKDKNSKPWEQPVAKNAEYKTVIETIQVPPPLIFWLSKDGLTRIVTGK